MITSHLLIKLSRFPDAMLRVIAIANTLFFASFLLVFMAAATQARAEQPTCAGQNLVATMKPDVLQKIEAEAAKTINGNARLWKIEKAGVKPSYLYGTMHATDDRVINLPEAAKAAYDDADIVVLEITELLDQAKAGAALLGRPDLMMFTDSTTIKSLVDPKDLPALEKGLQERGMALAVMNKMKPWMISSALAIPACETQRIKGGALLLDLKLGKDAQAAGRPVGALETVIEQFEAMAAVPMDLHIKGLVEAATMGDLMLDVRETMVSLYANGEISKIMPMIKSVAPQGVGGANNDTSFEEVMIDTRNATMAKRAVPFLNKGNAFIAVGALHLPGEKGLVKMLNDAGYTVTEAAK
jgi:uncharacterized protein